MINSRSIWLDINSCFQETSYLCPQFFIQEYTLLFLISLSFPLLALMLSSPEEHPNWPLASQIVFWLFHESSLKLHELGYIPRNLSRLTRCPTDLSSVDIKHLLARSDFPLSSGASNSAIGNPRHIAQKLCHYVWGPTKINVSMDLRSTLISPDFRSCCWLNYLQRYPW